MSGDANRTPSRLRQVPAPTPPVYVPRPIHSEDDERNRRFAFEAATGDHYDRLVFEGIVRAAAICFNRGIDVSSDVIDDRAQCAATWVTSNATPEEERAEDGAAMLSNVLAREGLLCGDD